MSYLKILNKEQVTIFVYRRLPLIHYSHLHVLSKSVIWLKYKVHQPTNYVGYCKECGVGLEDVDQY